FGHLRSSRVMVIGAGEMSRATARNLLSRGAHSIFVTNRSFERAEELAAELDGEAVRFDDWQNALQEVDVVISSTGSPHAVMDRAHVEAVRRKRRYRPLFLIDIAVPRDIEPEVGEIEEVYLYDIDTLKEIAQEAKGQRAEQVRLCERIIDQELVESGLFEP
ncbi:MAG TPA: glutamyl-tRNA reductase, partial [Verrucomicrobiales bacterium]|nr:glutamyl-tRNA reductase [Verrucomicrobiales bacterium]